MKSRRRCVSTKLVQLVGTGLLALLMVCGGLLVTPGTSMAAETVTNQQCGNQSDGLGPCEWIMGNVNHTKAQYFEGDSVPYRIVMEKLTANTQYWITFGWDTTKTASHALDYITTYDRSESFADPCSGWTGSVGPVTCSTDSTYAIPTDPQVTAAGVTPEAGDITLSNGTIDSVGSNAPDYNDGLYTYWGSYTGTSSALITVKFTTGPGQTAVVLAYGGHIATEADWGVGNSAVGITGSPYHSFLNGASWGSTGRQDLALAASAVIVPGSITIVKEANPEGATEFPFRLTRPDQTTADFTLVDDGTPSNTASFTDLSDFGLYGVEELVPIGWSLDSIVCDDGSPQTPPTASIDLAEGEDIACTFYDSLQPGKIIVDKVTDPSGSNQSFEFSPSYGSNFFLTDGDTPNDSGWLVPGTYGVAETVPTGWDLTDSYCDDGSPVSAIVLDPGETVICTFEDTERGKIIVDKVTDRAGSNQSFEFSPSYGSNFSLKDADPANDSGWLVPDTYSVSENVPGGWDLTSATCDDDDGSDPASIVLDPGETVTCIFTNTQRGKIIVDKVTDPAGSNQSFEFVPSYGFNFSLKDADPANDSGWLVPDTYSVSENVPGGWDLTSATCNDDDGSDPASIVLDPGETVTCIFTNTQLGSITVRKVTDPSPDLSNASFGFTAGGGLTPTGFSLGDGDSRGFGNLLPQSGYSVAETTIPAGWNLTSASCDDGSLVSNIDVSPGETVTCTFYNEATEACIEIVKDGDECAHPGEEITYSFSVHNCGDFQINNVTVTDPLWDPDLDVLLGSLQPDEVASFGRSYTVPSVFSGDVMPNTATVEGTDVLGRAVSDTDPHVVDIFHPCIDVTKTHLASGRPGGKFFWGDNVMYKMQVTNCSAGTPLNNVTLVDQWEFPYSGTRKSWSIGYLGPGVTRSFSYIYTTSEADGDDIINKATATGEDDCNRTVTDTDFDELPLGAEPPEEEEEFVPEWGSMLLLASGLASLGAYARLRFRKQR